jgi:predicted esterase
VRLLGVAGAAAALLACGAHPSAAGSPPDRLEGPFGRGASQVWLLVPRAPVRAVVVFGHGWKVAPPSASYPWANQFRPWLDHLAAAGAAVIFPRYQLGTGDSQGPARLEAFRRGLVTGFARLGVARAPVVAAGYSYGATLAFYYAASAGRWRLPRPLAVDAVFPAGMIAGAVLPPLPGGIRVLIQVGDADTEAGTAGADAFWAWLRAHPPALKSYVVVHSSRGFAATHAAPKGTSAATRRAFWQPLDGLLAAVRRGGR